MATAVVLADPYPPTCAGHAALLDAEPDLEVVGKYTHGAEACAAAEQLRPEVVLTSIQLADMSGIELTRRLAARPGLGQVRVVVLADAAPCPLVFEALGAGARGFLFKDSDIDDLPRTVRLVANGEARVSSRITRPLIDEWMWRTEAPALDGLTPREREVLSLIGKGLSTEEIAASLFVAPTTAKTHVNRAMVKLGVRSRTRLVAIAYESGLVHPARARDQFHRQAVM